MRAQPVRDADGRIMNWIGSTTDIDDQKQSEERLRQAKEMAESANRAKDQFLAALSHELRTPLTPVLLSAAALENDSTLSEAARSEMSLIRRNVELEARLIDDLLDLTRIARGKLKLDLRLTDPLRVIRAALEVCEDDLNTKGLTIRLEPPSDQQQVCVKADPARLQQVFWNLIKNSVKFTPTGGRISISCDVSQSAFCVQVTDTGVGIEPENLPRIFDAFEQGSEKIGRQFGGLGLGLAISKAVIDMHGGRLIATSAGKNRGATFIVTLPLAQDQPVVEKSRLPRATPAGKPLRILLVEDHDATSRVLSLLLKQMNHQVTAAPTVADALRHVEAAPFDLLISDLGLPDGTGLDLMRQIRQKHAITGICLSGYGMDQDIIQSREAGFIEHLIKPVDLPRLKSAIESVTQ
jgi:signal transduction histidine kinase